MQTSVTALKLQIRHHWWLALCFVIPFLIAGCVGWLLVAVENDHPGQALIEKEFDENEHQMKSEAKRQFWQFGLEAGSAGLLVGIGGICLAQAWKRKHQG